MGAFKDFMNETISGGFGLPNYVQAYGKSGKQMYGGQAYMPTYALTKRWDALMGPARRQLLDDDEPGQLYQKYIILLRSIISKVDTKQLIDGKASDVYKIVYTSQDLLKAGYPPEDLEKLKELEIVQKQYGYHYNKVIKAIGKDIDKINEFIEGKINPRQFHLIPEIGWYLSEEQIAAIKEKTGKYLSAQDAIERGLQYIGTHVGSEISRGASMDRIGDIPALAN